MTLALALLVDHAQACPPVDVDVEGVEVAVKCTAEVDDYEDVEDAPQASVVSDDGGGNGDSLLLQYGMQFLPDMPGHQLSARYVGDRDSYVGGELRYTPGSDVMWVGRVGAGLDLFGKSDFDLTLGLFLGTAGEWDFDRDAARLYAAPIAGTEVGIGWDGDRLFGKYRWLGGLGGGPIDELLTENEFTLGYKLTRGVHVYGQYLLLAPGEADNQSGVGIGARVAF